MYAKEVLAMHFAFDEFGHILWSAKKPRTVMMNNKALTRFFQTKHIPPSPWNFCDQTLQFKFILAHVPGVEKLAADYLSRLEIRLEERVHLKLTDSTPEIDIASKTPKQEEDEPDHFPLSESLRQKKPHDAQSMKGTNSETVTLDNGKPMKTVDVATTDNDDDKTINCVDSTPLVSEVDHISSPRSTNK